MKYETTYQVVRPFSGHREIGAILGESDFASPHRAAQLLDQRFIAPVMMKKDYQPSILQLLESPIRELRTMIGDVVDVCILREVVTREVREVAIKLFEKRLEELETNNAQYT